MKKYLPYIILALALIGVAAWGYPIVKQRYLQKAAPADTQSEEIVQDSDADTIDSEDTNLAEDEDGDALSDEETDEETADDADADLADDSEAFLNVLPSDCEDGCQDFTEPDDIQYCREFCGLNKKKATGCETLEDLDRDYCIKAEAIEKKDIKKCDDIEDSGIRRACKDRIAEDIADVTSPAE